uniref:Malic enzyme n=1 Tax=Mesocestoides corti TaxID=53468 RepID=A0A5K3F190_MESCO
MTQLNNSLQKCGAAYSLNERQVLGLHGLLPPAVLTQSDQVQSVLTNLYALEDDLGRYNTLMSLQDRNEKLFYKTVRSNLEYLIPLIYTPTVGKACLNYGMILRRPRGLYITINDKGHVRSILRNWPEKRVKAVVMTDGERILGLGDLGAQGMGIPIGKCALYTALGGVDPRACLPLMIDVGTNNESLLENEFYLGLRQKRIGTEQYYELMDEVMESLVDLYGPNVSIQFEDLANKNGFAFLERYGKDYIVFNDDIQGSAAAVALAGLISSTRITKTSLSDNKYLLYGAGAAGTGIANILVAAMKDEGASDAQARSRIYMMDSKGLLVKSRPGGVVESHKMPFVRDDVGHVERLSDAITQIRPSVLIGAAAVPGAFTRDILNMMATINKRPVIFALSNPTEKAECTAEAAFKSTECRCIFVSGSPFPEIRLPSGQEFYPSQGNNYYVFPGVAMAVTSAQIRPLTQDLFLAAAKALAGLVTEEDLAVGRTYPPVSKLPEVAHKIAVELVTRSFANGTAQYQPEPADKVEFIRSLTYDPSYADFTPDYYEWPSGGQ